MKLFEKIRHIKYPAYWRGYRLLFLFAIILLMFLVFILFMNTGRPETRYIQQEVSVVCVDTFRFSTEIRMIPREFTAYPAITWIILLLFIGSAIVYFIADLIYWRCERCDAPFWFWMSGSLLQLFANNCPRCGAEIDEMTGE